MNNCLFCHNINKNNILTENEHFFVILDIDPIQQGHILIISKKHYTDIREIPNEILSDLFTLEKEILTILETHFNIFGTSIIQNNGGAMDKGTHFHIHLIPRYTDDNFWENQQVVQKKIDISLLKKINDFLSSQKTNEMM